MKRRIECARGTESSRVGSAGPSRFFVKINGYSQKPPHDRMYATHLHDATHSVVGGKNDAVADRLMKLGCDGGPYQKEEGHQQSIKCHEIL